MKKFHIVLICLSILLFIILGAAWYMGLISFSSGGKWKPMNITQENVAQVISATSLVQDLPSDAKIQVDIGEKSYYMKKGIMASGSVDSADVKVQIPEGYLKIMGEYGPCAAIASARNNGDLGVKYDGSTSSLAWKYKGLVKYKSCLG